MKTRLLLLVLLLGIIGAVFASEGDAASALSLRRQKQGAAPKKEAATKPSAQKPSAQKPKVTEIKEAGLKSLLDESAAKSRPLLVNFWATWCTPCREEFPDLVKLREHFADDALDFVTISLDDPSDITTAVPDFLAEMRAQRIPAYLLNAVDEDAAVNLVDATWRKELPATFLFDRAGTLAFKHMGRIKPAELTAAIEKTQAQKQK